jgi:chromosome segregation ATPase
MSRTQTRKEIVSELEELKAAAEATAELHKAEVAAIEAERDEARAQINGLTKQVDEANAKVVELGVVIEAGKAERDEISAKLDEVSAELETAKQTLVNPAVDDAQLRASDDLPVSQADAEADEAEAAAQVEIEEQAKADEPTFEKFQAISDPYEKGAYYNANREAILASMQ